MTKIYRAGTLKEKKRTNERLEQFDQQIIDLLEQDYPQSIWHVFYRMADMLRGEVCGHGE